MSEVLIYEILTVLRNLLYGILHQFLWKCQTYL